MTTQEAVMRINLPWPNKVLSPNARAHWFVKAKAAKAARSDAWLATLEAMKGVRPKWPRAALTWVFNPPSKRRFDTDNLIAQHKHAQDGIADALGINDALFISTYRMGEPVKGGAVLIEVRPA